jgi:hypothetical protein
MHVSLLFIIIFLLIVGPEILHIAFAGVIKAAGLLFGFFAAMATLMGLCWGAQVVFHILVRFIGRDVATEILDALIEFSVLVLPFILLADSKEGYAGTKAIFRLITRKRYTKSVKKIA